MSATNADKRWFWWWCICYFTSVINVLYLYKKHVNRTSANMSAFYGTDYSIN